MKQIAREELGKKFFARVQAHGILGEHGELEVEPNTMEFSIHAKTAKAALVEAKRKANLPKAGVHAVSVYNSVLAHFRGEKPIESWHSKEAKALFRRMTAGD